MTINGTKRSYEGTEYDTTSLDKDYKDLLDSIFKRLTANALEHVLIPPDTATKDILWDGRYFYRFIINLQPDDKEAFKKLLSENGVNYGALEKLPSQGITVEKAEIATCTAAEIHEISLKKYIESYVIRCKRKKYNIKGFFGHEKIITNIFKEYSQNSDLTFDYEDNNLLNDPSKAAYSAPQPTLTIPEPKIGNINYFANVAHPLIGRGKQKILLKKFLKCDLENSQVAWFQLAGVAGQGKSRLAFELIHYALKKLKWRAGFLTESAIHAFKDHWKDWQPNEPHLFVFDYVIGREGEIKSILQSLIHNSEKFQFKIRVLFVERQRWDQSSFRKLNVQNNKSYTTNSKFISDKAEWFLKLRENDDPEADRITSIRFDSGVEELKELDVNDLLVIVRKLVKQFSFQDLTL